MRNEQNSKFVHTKMNKMRKFLCSLNLYLTHLNFLKNLLQHKQDKSHIKCSYQLKGDYEETFGGDILIALTVVMVSCLKGINFKLCKMNKFYRSAIQHSVCS